MRDWVVVFIIIVFIFLLSIFLREYFIKSGKEMVDNVEKIRLGINADDADTKKENVKELKEKWSEQQRIWIMFQHHDMINEMEDLLLECCNYYLISDEKSFNVSFDKLKRNIDDLKNKEDFSLENIM